MAKHNWKWYERSIADIFSRVEGAVVEHDVRETGAMSHEERQIDVRVTYPMKMDLGGGFEISIPLKIIVDCKAHGSALDVQDIGLISVLKNDVQAHLAVAVTPEGVSTAGRELGKSLGVYTVTVTDDLISLARGLNAADSERCSACEYGWVSWGLDQTHAYCDHCGQLHLRCPDCRTVVAINDQFNVGIKCGSECGTVFLVPADRKGIEGKVEVYDRLDCLLMEKASNKTNKRLTRNEVSRIIAKTKWEHWEVADPTIDLTEKGLMDWRDGYLYLSKDGQKVVRDVIDRAEAAEYY